MKSNGLYVLKNSFGDPCPLWKYDLLEEDNPSYLLHNLLYMDVIFVFTFYYIYFCHLWHYIYIYIYIIYLFLFFEIL
jgi:hypothetical protein